jgi:hypothetical protein
MRSDRVGFFFIGIPVLFLGLGLVALYAGPSIDRRPLTLAWYCEKGFSPISQPDPAMIDSLRMYDDGSDMPSPLGGSEYCEPKHCQKTCTYGACEVTATAKNMKAICECVQGRPMCITGACSP